MVESDDNWLLTEALRTLLVELTATSDDDAPDDAPEDAREAVWTRADALLAQAEAEEDAELAIPVWDRDRAALEKVLAAWDAGSRALPEWDKAVLKRAFKAFKKRLKILQLDDVSTAGRNPLSSGRESTILGVKPPEQYPADVWATLVKQGKLRDGGSGLLELATE